MATYYTYNYCAYAHKNTSNVRATQNTFINSGCGTSTQKTTVRTLTYPSTTRNNCTLAYGGVTSTQTPGTTHTYLTNRTSKTVCNYQARWTPNSTFSITLKNYYGPNTSASYIACTSGTITNPSINFTFPNPTATGYTFSMGIGGPGGFDVSGTNYTVYDAVEADGHWSSNTYTITLYKNGGSGGTDTVTETYGSGFSPNPITTPTNDLYATCYFDSCGGTSCNPITTGASFTGYLGNDHSGNVAGIIGATGIFNTSITPTYTSDIMLTAQGNYYINLPSTTRTGYTFKGGYSASSGGYKRGDIGSYVSTSSGEVFYAQWTPKSRTIILNPDSGSGGTTSLTETCDTGFTPSTITKPTPPTGYTVSFDSQEGTSCDPRSSTYSFYGYYDNTSASGTIRINSSGNVVSSYNGSAPTTWYANYTHNSITLPSTTRERYEFDGWYTSGGVKVGNAGDAYTPTAAITLYAHGNATSRYINIYKDSTWVNAIVYVYNGTEGKETAPYIYTTEGKQI